MLPPPFIHPHGPRHKQNLWEEDKSLWMSTHMFRGVEVKLFMICDTDVDRWRNTGPERKHLRNGLFSQKIKTPFILVLSIIGVCSTRYAWVCRPHVSLMVVEVALGRDRLILYLHFFFLMRPLWKYSKIDYEHSFSQKVKCGYFSHSMTVVLAT